MRIPLPVGISRRNVKPPVRDGAASFKLPPESRVDVFEIRVGPVCAVNVELAEHEFVCHVAGVSGRACSWLRTVRNVWITWVGDWVCLSDYRKD